MKKEKKSIEIHVMSWQIIHMRRSHFIEKLKIIVSYPQFDTFLEPISTLLFRTSISVTRFWRLQLIEKFKKHYIKRKCIVPCRKVVLMSSIMPVKSFSTSSTDGYCMSNKSCLFCTHWVNYWPRLIGHTIWHCWQGHVMCKYKHGWSILLSCIPLSDRGPFSPELYYVPSSFSNMVIINIVTTSSSWSW